MAHLDAQVSATKEIVLVICLLCTMFVLFSETLTNCVFINANCSPLEVKVNGIIFYLVYYRNGWGVVLDRLEESARLYDVFQCTVLLCFGTVHFKEIKSAHTTSILYCYPLHDLVTFIFVFSD